MPTGEVVREWVESETLGILAVAISADGTTIALKLYDGTIKVSHLPTGESHTLQTSLQESEAILKTVDSARRFEKLVFSSSGSVLFVSSVLHARKLHAFLVDSGEKVKEFVYETGIGDYEITRDGKLLVVGTKAGEIEVESLESLLENR
jgi:WD40 repeat protein